LAEILTTKEVAEYLNLHQFTVCRYAAKDLIPAIRIGKVWRFDKEAVDAWIRSTRKKRKIFDKSRGKTGILSGRGPK
jgi:excisionase family DNA binding protein